MSLQDQIESSVTDSLVQLGRGSGISPEARERMAKIISAPVVFIVEDHTEAAREEAERKTKERLRTALDEAAVRVRTLVGTDDISYAYLAAHDALEPVRALLEPVQTPPQSEERAESSTEVQS